MDQRLLECPICFAKYAGKIFLCKEGHGICEMCRKRVKHCPKCKKPMTMRRSYDLEALVQEVALKVKVSCDYIGCTYTLTTDKLDDHQSECKFRTHHCIAAVFARDTCTWCGSYTQILQHFEQAHRSRLLSSNVKEFNIRIRLNQNAKDVCLLDYLDGKQLLYYKNKIDPKKAMVYWMFQFVGTRHEAKHYSYEFEINRGLLKYKITGICAADVDDLEAIFDEERCVCMSFKQIKHYMNEHGDIQLRFRIFNNAYMNQSKN